MIKILVISDTHDDPSAMEWTLEYLERENIDTVIHLGDYYDDADILQSNGYNLVRVPGTWDTAYYPDPAVENRKFIDVAGWRIFLTHTPESHYNDLALDIKPESIIVEGKADVFLYGHTHMADLRKRDNIIFFNPGHLTSYECRGCPMTYGLLEIDHDTMNASIIRIRDHKRWYQGTFEKASLKMPAGI
ncbi:MAG: YfcE family phosphodiesterase [Deltaproteobacteria bacterium]|nr:YfcE family phosphodiesterase [Deltaproteobacteria bacterium]